MSVYVIMVRYDKMDVLLYLNVMKTIIKLLRLTNILRARFLHFMLSFWSTNYHPNALGISSIIAMPFQRNWLKCIELYELICIRTFIFDFLYLARNG